MAITSSWLILATWSPAQRICVPLSCTPATMPWRPSARISMLSCFWDAGNRSTMRTRNFARSGVFSRRNASFPKARESALGRWPRCDRSRAGCDRRNDPRTAAPHCHHAAGALAPVPESAAVLPAVTDRFLVLLLDENEAAAYAGELLQGEQCIIDSSGHACPPCLELTVTSRQVLRIASAVNSRRSGSVIVTSGHCSPLELCCLGNSTRCLPEERGTITRMPEICTGPTCTVTKALTSLVARAGVILSTLTRFCGLLGVYSSLDEDTPVLICRLSSAACS